MRFMVEREIFKLFPELRLGIVVAANISNGGSGTEIIEIIRDVESKLRLTTPKDKLGELPLILNWRAAYKSLRIKDGTTSHEALIRRVLRGDEIPLINKLVDIYNSLSLEFITPLGGEDLDRVKGEIRLKLANGKEEFVQLGTSEISHPEPGEVIYYDGEKVLCRKFNWRESELTKLTESTKNAFFVAETLPPFSEASLDDLLSKFAESLSKYCGANATTYKIDSKNTEIQW